MIGFTTSAAWLSEVTSPPYSSITRCSPPQSPIPMSAPKHTQRTPSASQDREAAPEKHTMCIA
eukprot:485225-Rhodomonas_salina.2